MMTAQDQIVRKMEDFATGDTQEKRQLLLMHGADGCTIPALREYPSRLFVETTTRCKLRCRMCVKQTGLGGGGKPAVVVDFQGMVDYAKPGQ